MKYPFTDSDTVDDDEPLPGEAAPPDAEIIPLVTPPAVGCGCPICAAQAALTLVSTGRPGMARTVLEGLSHAIRTALKASHEAGVAEGLRMAEGALQRPPPPPAAQRRAIPRKPAAPARRTLPPALPRKPRPHEMLDAALIARRVTAEWVAEALGIHPRDVPALAAGTVGLPNPVWAKLLDQIADHIAAKEGLS